MDVFLLELDEPGAQDPLRSGAKAATLATLLGAGLPALAGSIITTDAFGSGASESGYLPEPARAAVREVSVRRGNDALVVRSSAVAEDQLDASFAGVYETVLDVRGPDALEGAVLRCWTSANRTQATAYREARGIGGASSYAVLIQSYVEPEVAGVAFGADPVTGDRGVVLVSAVPGHPAALVDGEAEPEVWRVRASRPRRVPDRRRRILSVDQVRRVAALVRRIEDVMGGPTDVEWAIVDGTLVVLQARPMTSVPEPISWPAPPSGGWSRSIRLGEWLPEPVTPLFTTWLLDRIEGRFSDRQVQDGGLHAPGPLHVIVNGWYFHSPVGRGRAPTLVGGLVRRPRLAAATVLASHRPDVADRLAFAKIFRAWSDRTLGAYRRVVERAESRVETAGPADLVGIVDELGDAAGDFLWSLVLCGGVAWRAEVALARLCRRYASGSARPLPQVLLSGLVEPVVGPHSVHSLDWFRSTLGESAPTAGPVLDQSRPSRAMCDRQQAELVWRAALAGRPRRRARFDRVLRTAQTYAVLRAEHSAWFTRPWPVLRQCVAGLGAELRHLRVLDEADDVHFISRAELDACLGGHPPEGLNHKAADRRRTWERQRHLRPPLHIGRSSVVLSGLLLNSPRFMRSTARSGAATLTGTPAGSGRCCGPVRILLDLSASQEVVAGEVLVVRAAPPALTPLFGRIAALCVDGGSVAAHASIVAREYGLPVVVGLGDATSRLRDGAVVTVDGDAGTVHIESRRGTADVPPVP